MLYKDWVQHLNNLNIISLFIRSFVYHVPYLLTRSSENEFKVKVPFKYSNNTECSMCKLNRTWKSTTVVERCIGSQMSVESGEVSDHKEGSSQMW
jgi:hypothetical protein